MEEFIMPVDQKFRNKLFISEVDTTEIFAYDADTVPDWTPNGNSRRFGWKATAALLSVEVGIESYWESAWFEQSIKIHTKLRASFHPLYE